MKVSLSKLGWRLLLLAGSLVLAGKVVTVNMADHHLAAATKGDTGALDKAVLWDHEHPRVLALQGAQAFESGEFAAAERKLSAAIIANPADARPLMLMAELRRRAGELEIADKMVETANRLMPVDARIQRQIAAYWYTRGSLERAIPHLANALSSDISYKEALFPVLLQIAENSTAREKLKPITDNPPPWWESFAIYASRNAEDVNSLRALAKMRRQSDVRTVATRARNAYIDRLKKEGLIAEAYLMWVDGLSKEQRGTLAYLFNGNFEQEFSQSGFGWYANPPRNSRIVISTAKTYGIEGDQALYLSFGGKRQPFSHLRQSLFLSPGSYQLSGKVRVDQLQARKGLQWAVSCSSGMGGLLGESQRFIGASDWHAFDFEINVPQGCKGQLLQLKSVGHRDVDHELKGDIWFDDLRIRLQR